MCPTCRSTVLPLSVRLSAIRALDMPSAMRRVRPVLGRSASEPAGALLAGHQPTDDGWVDHGFTVGYPLQCVDQDMDVRNSLLGGGNRRWRSAVLIGQPRTENQGNARAAARRPPDAGGGSAAATSPSSVCVGGILMSTMATSGPSRATARSRRVGRRPGLRPGRRPQ